MAPIPTTRLKRTSIGAVLAVIGFVLSPLSWWNDLIVNVPLALGFAWLVSWFHADAFAVSFVVGYWLTNVLGLVLLQYGAKAALSRQLKPYRARALAKDLAIALLYTLFIIALVKLKVLAPLPDYFR